jgi:ElaB/YqjD/DUF883 family membrane-anchored ribosome-binding protein
MTERDVNRGTGFNPGSTQVPLGGTTSQPPSSGARSSATDMGSEASSAAKDAGGKLKEKINEDWQSAKSSAQTQFSQASQKARDAADEQKNFAAERVSGLAAAIEKVGNELEQGDQREIGRYAKEFGSSIHRFADEIKGKDMSQIASMAEDFGRRQPAAFIGIAALAGFAASRFLTASAERRAGGDTTSRGGLSENTTARSAASPAATTATTPVSPATGAGYATGYSPEGTRNG